MNKLLSSGTAKDKLSAIAYFIDVGGFDVAIEGDEP
jgi:hypothetical protein